MSYTQNFTKQSSVITN